MCIFIFVIWIEIFTNTLDIFLFLPPFSWKKQCGAWSWDTVVGYGSYVSSRLKSRWPLSMSYCVLIWLLYDRIQDTSFQIRNLLLKLKAVRLLIVCILYKPAVIFIILDVSSSYVLQVPITLHKFRKYN